MLKQKQPFLSSRGWKILFNYLFEYKNEVILLSVFGVISAFANAVVPYLVGIFFDSIIDQSFIILSGDFEMPKWVLILVIWSFIQIIVNLVDWFLDSRSRGIGTKVHAEYSARISSHLLTLPVSFHKEYKHGDVYDRISRASSLLSGIIERVIITLAPRLLSVVIGLGIAYYINPLLASILVLGVVIYIFTLTRVVPPIVKLQFEGQKAWNKAYGYAYDAVSNFQTVKQFTAEDYEKKKITSMFIDGAYKFWFKVEKIWASINFFQRVTVFLTQLAIFVVSVFFIQSGKISIGELIALNGYAMIIFGPFVQLGQNWQTIQNGIVAIERAEDIISLPGEDYESEKKKKIVKISGSVEFQNVTFKYRSKEKKVLDNIKFSVKPGEVIAFVGESGVGKSTVIDLISAYYFPTSGRVMIDGVDTRDINIEKLRRQLAVVPQEVTLFNDTVEKNIKYGNTKASKKEVQDAAKKAYADIFIEKFSKKYKQLVGERGIKLSVGQKQRIAIARAILRNPSILILDEPTSALDASAEEFIKKSLRDLMQNRTTFIIAHRLSTVRRADRIFVFDKGRVVEEGNHEELMKLETGIYSKLYKLHIGLK